MPPLIEARLQAARSDASVVHIPERKLVTSAKSHSSDKEGKNTIPASYAVVNYAEKMEPVLGISQVSHAGVSELTHHANLAAAAYCPQIMTSPKYPEALGSVVAAFNSSSPHNATAFVSVSDENMAIYVAFAGSVGPRDFIDHSSYNMTSYTPVDNAHVNSQIYDAYLSIEEKLIMTLADLIPKKDGYQIKTVGHSMGGALATFAALDIYQRFQGANSTDIFIYSYGEPRVGDLAFAKYANATNISKYRVVNWADAVPHMPNLDNNGTFVHFGLEMLIGNAIPQLTWQCDTDQLESEYCSNLLPDYDISYNFRYYDASMGECP
ncbi:alpha/beta-hydrolase [Hesseltinella vesiculosa]|uniref:Alpha/beta-hydrolase n=1 Tax=Hesseltinella vesiculosa TaxID=101127 RepID=A0A1X2GXN3_9FUNG|nr:alpha/beta-hydrolase [Hesseltinella vesiculosa]